MRSAGALLRIRWLLIWLLVFTGAVSAAVELPNGGAYTWHGLTLFAPSDRWTVNEGDGAVALYRRSDGGYVAGNLLLRAPDAGLAAAAAGRLAEGGRDATREELVRFLAGECRARYGQVFGLQRLDADGAEPAAALFFTTVGSDGERRVRAYAFLTGDGVYLLYLACTPEVEERLGAELDRLAGELCFR